MFHQEKMVQPLFHTYFFEEFQTLFLIRNMFKIIVNKKTYYCILNLQSCFLVGLLKGIQKQYFRLYLHLALVVFKTIIEYKIH